MGAAPNQRAEHGARDETDMAHTLSDKYTRGALSGFTLALVLSAVEAFKAAGFEIVSGNTANPQRGFLLNKGEVFVYLDHEMIVELDRGAYAPRRVPLNTLTVGKAHETRLGEQGWLRALDAVADR